MNAIKNVLLTTLFTLSSAAYGAIARVVPVSYDQNTQQWNVLVGHDIQGDWNDFRRPLESGVRANITASRAMKEDTNGTYDIQITGAMPWRKDRNTGDFVHFVQVNYKPGRELWKCARNAKKNDFAWIPVAELLNNASVTRPHQKKPVKVSDGFLKMFKELWPAVANQLNAQQTANQEQKRKRSNSPVQQSQKKQRSSGAWHSSNFVNAIYFYDNKPKSYYEFTNFQTGYPITINGKQWPTTEHYYQAMKFTDPNLQEQVRQLQTAREAFNFARNNKSKVRQDWQNMSLQTMYEAVWAKFSQHPTLQKLLLDTGHRVLVEDAGKNDDFFGAGQDYNGKNYLGQILMQVRAELRQNRVQPVVFIVQDPSVYQKADYDYDLL